MDSNFVKLIAGVNVESFNASYYKIILDYFIKSTGRTSLTISPLRALRYDMAKLQKVRKTFT
jgi:hypothetical protein